MFSGVVRIVVTVILLIFYFEKVELSPCLRLFLDEPLIIQLKCRNLILIGVASIASLVLDLLDIKSLGLDLLGILQLGLRHLLHVGLFHFLHLGNQISFDVFLIVLLLGNYCLQSSYLFLKLNSFLLVIPVIFLLDF